RETNGMDNLGSESDSTDSAEWTKVRKRNKTNRKTQGDVGVQGPILGPLVARYEVKENKSHVSVAVQPTDQSYHSARYASLQ
ncbi:hypothetical protein U1Q18_047248, partial [Sarracenia purpurea var. burkii]